MLDKHEVVVNYNLVRTLSQVWEVDSGLTRYLDAYSFMYPSAFSEALVEGVGRLTMTEQNELVKESRSLILRLEGCLYMRLSTLVYPHQYIPLWMPGNADIAVEIAKAAGGDPLVAEDEDLDSDVVAALCGIHRRLVVENAPQMALLDTTAVVSLAEFTLLIDHMVSFSFGQFDVVQLWRESSYPL